MKLRLIALAAIGAFTLAACQTNADFYGNGPITLSNNVTDGFERYKKNFNPGAFAISLDGRSAGWSYCPAGQCGGSNSLMLAIHSCQESGKTCKIYAMGPTVVWNHSAPAATPVTKSSTITNITLCQMAMRRDGSGWDDSAAYKSYRQEVDRRSITLDQCRQLTGRS